MKTLMFYILHPNTEHRDCLRDTGEKYEKMEESVQPTQRAEGGNYGNAELSVNGRGRGLNNVMSYCFENQYGRPIETVLD